LVYPYYSYGGLMKKTVFCFFIVLFSISAWAQSTPQIKNFDYEVNYHIYRVLADIGVPPKTGSIYFTFVYRDNKLNSTFIECAKSNSVPTTKYADLHVYGTWINCQDQPFSLFDDKEEGGYASVKWCHSYNPFWGCTDDNADLQIVKAKLPL